MIQNPTKSRTKAKKRNNWLDGLAATVIFLPQSAAPRRGKNSFPAEARGRRGVEKSWIRS
jgi:hypothetical protein